MTKNRCGAVVFLGSPNVGKSTLLNTLLETSLSIVTPKAQTTRNSILGIYTDPQKGQILLRDTPGLENKPTQPVFSQLMETHLHGSVCVADCIWYIHDIHQDHWLPEEEEKHRKLLSSLPSHPVPLILLFNKIEREGTTSSVYLEKKPSVTRVQTFLSSLASPSFSLVEKYFISAKKKKGLAPLLEKTWSYLPEKDSVFPEEDQLSDQPLRFFVAEKIREKLLLCLGQEVPYSCAVMIDIFEEKEKKSFIQATIHVERESQKGIVIGEKGKKIKEISEKSRHDLEEFLGFSLFLDLRVKVLKNWTTNHQLIKKMGFFS